MGANKDKEIEKQFKEAEEYRKANYLSIGNSQLTNHHPQAYYTSRLLNPFTKDLPKYDDINNKNSVNIVDSMEVSTEDESLNPFTKDLSKYDNINNNSVEIFDFTKISTEDESKNKQSEEK
ncbi:kinase-like domain-containing protein [Rhizophagus irregularis DAOM 181602=DAOM 197198]|nr:kinase-like domain-containing protein [Rhizophagus irregularis DAOM 181602=DAOM 197198]